MDFPLRQWWAELCKTLFDLAVRIEVRAMDMDVTLTTVMGLMVMIVMTYRLVVTGAFEINRACHINLMLSVECARERRKHEATGNEE